MGNLLLLLIVPVVLIVIGCIAIYVGITNSRTVFRDSRPIWYRNAYILMGITAFLISVLILVDDVRNNTSQIPHSTTIIFLIIEAILLLSAVISCFFMLRYLLGIRRKRIDDR
jgi:uncharacterized membrane protein